MNKYFGKAQSSGGGAQINTSTKNASADHEMKDVSNSTQPQKPKFTPWVEK